MAQLLHYQLYLIVTFIWGRIRTRALTDALEGLQPKATFLRAPPPTAARHWLCCSYPPSLGGVASLLQLLPSHTGPALGSLESHRKGGKERMDKDSV